MTTTAYDRLRRIKELRDGYEAGRDALLGRGPTWSSNAVFLSPTYEDLKDHRTELRKIGRSSLTHMSFRRPPLHPRPRRVPSRFVTIIHCPHAVSDFYSSDQPGDERLYDMQATHFDTYCEQGGVEECDLKVVTRQHHHMQMGPSADSSPVERHRWTVQFAEPALDKPIEAMEDAQLGLARVRQSLAGLTDEVISGVMAEFDAGQRDFSSAYLHLIHARVLLDQVCGVLVAQSLAEINAERPL